MPTYIVRFGVMRSLGVFASRDEDAYHRGQQVIARTGRGLESGEVLCEATEGMVAHLKEQKQGQILRTMSEDDAHDLRKMLEQERREYDVCIDQIARLGLDMRLVDVEHLYGGERVVVYYLAEGRVDFRELVKVLAKEFQTRIEMRQIGVRDEAKLLADYGDCGKPVCCNTHLCEMPPVSMKMAKLQRATLDPSKISGRCGRLKCCLRYEYETYQALQAELPAVGAEVVTSSGRARVLAQEILARQLLVETEDMRRVVIDASDVVTVLSRGKKRRRGREGSASGEPDDGPTQPPDADVPASGNGRAKVSDGSSAADGQPEAPDVDDDAGRR